LITEGSTLVEAFSSDSSIPSSLTFNENSSILIVKYKGLDYIHLKMKG